MSTPKVDRTPDDSSPRQPRRRRRAAASVLYPVSFVFDTPRGARLIRGTDLDPGSRSFLDD